MIGRKSLLSISRQELGIEFYDRGGRLLIGYLMERARNAIPREMTFFSELRCKRYDLFL